MNYLITAIATTVAIFTTAFFYATNKTPDGTVFFLARITNKVTPYLIVIVFLAIAVVVVISLYRDRIVDEAKNEANKLLKKAEFQIKNSKEEQKIKADELELQYQSKTKRLKAETIEYYEKSEVDLEARRKKYREQLTTVELRNRDLRAENKSLRQKNAELISLLQDKPLPRSWSEGNKSKILKRRRNKISRLAAGGCCV